MSKILTSERRLKNPGVNGIIFVLNESYFDKFNRQLMSNPVIEGKLITKLHRVGGVEIYDPSGNLTRFIQIQPRGNNQFIISYFTGNNEFADFSITMTVDLKRKGILFKDITSGINRTVFHNLRKFVMGIFWYAYCKRIDSKTKIFKIEDDDFSSWEVYRNSK